MNLELQPFKRNEYDRGTKKIVIDGTQWGWLYMASHGCHGPTYSAHDMHDAVYVPRGEGWGRRTGEPIESQFRPKGRKDHRWSGVKPPSTDAQLMDYVRSLIVGGHLRAPDIRDREVAGARATMREAGERYEREKREALDRRAQDIIFMVADGKSNDEVKAAIVDAMKWAQTQ